MQSKGYIIAIVLLAVLAGAEGILYVPLQSSYSSLSHAYDELKESYSRLQSDYSSLYDAYNALQAKYDRLNADHTSLRSSYSTLQNDYETLEQSYNDLLNDYSHLLEDYKSLLEDYDVLQGYYEVKTTLRIGNSLASYYDVLRKKFGTWRSDTEMVQFAADLVSHGLGRIYWTSLENEFYQEAGEHSYDVARVILNYALNLTGSSISQDPTERIARILGFINKHIHYEYDVENVLLAPAETLTFKSGDCEDFTILAAVLFEAVGIDSAVAYFSHKDLSAEKQYHMMVLVHLDNLGEYGYWYYSDLTSMGVAPGKWIIIEPQKTIDDQGSDWVGQWNLLAAAPIDE
ncbi:hypothetical protein KEJ27_05895 [Candidatus Bathyarchaeota archaeon]|nr:hypothetical protein [Candidatus Bathyarchaeota archaeon]MBS7618762.1 hypothetical protein [Candidatus Bathyarchaeota archaeon]